MTTNTPARRVFEATDLLKLALAQLSADSGELKGKAIVRLAIIDIETDRFNEGLGLLTDNASLFEKINNYTLKGSAEPSS